MLEKIICPVLALDGEKDLQVPPNENGGSLKNAFLNGRNSQLTITVVPKLNHLLQEIDTGSPLEYASIDQDISTKALEVVCNWILKHTK